MISLNEFDPPDDESLSPEERALLEKFRNCEDIVHDWDDWGPGGFAAVWGKVFAEAFAPP